jgi:CheY-like chemotaxis protein
MRRLKLLVAIRSETDRELIRAYLSPTDYLLVFAMTGTEAVDTLLFNPGFDLVLADVSLSVSGGTGISAAIRKYNPYIPLIGMTAYPVDWVLKQNGGPGVDRWLAKPFSRQELEIAVWKLITKVTTA